MRPVSQLLDDVADMFQEVSYREREWQYNKMEILERSILYTWAALGLLAPVVTFLFFQHAYPDAWLTELQKYQALAGAFVALFAASLGSLGLLLNVRTQPGRRCRPGDLGRFCHGRLKTRQLALACSAIRGKTFS
jgi:hypothetical protein